MLMLFHNSNQKPDANLGALRGASTTGNSRKRRPSCSKSFKRLTPRDRRNVLSLRRSSVMPKGRRAMSRLTQVGTGLLH